MINKRSIATCIFCLLIVVQTLFAKEICDFSTEVKFLKHDPKLLPDNIPFYDNKHSKQYFDEIDNKTILLVFWASWLPQSRELLRKLDSLQKDFRKLDFTIIAVSEDYLGMVVIEEFFQKNDIRHINIYYDSKNAIYNFMGITSLPSFFLITSGGEELITILGDAKWDQDSVRNTLLSYIPGNPPIQKNTYDKSSLNVIFNSKYHLDHKAHNKVGKSLSKEPIQGTTRDYKQTGGN